MYKFTMSMIGALLVLALFGLTATPAVAQTDHIEPESAFDELLAPLPYTSVHVRGDVFANGTSIGMIDFAVVWSEEDPSQVQLWALLDDRPTLVCYGTVFKTPSGEPIFSGSTTLMKPAGICQMAQLPNRSGITLFAASDDGQWATSILRSTNQAEPVPIFD